MDSRGKKRKVSVNMELEGGQEDPQIQNCKLFSSMKGLLRSLCKDTAGRTGCGCVFVLLVLNWQLTARPKLNRNVSQHLYCLMIISLLRQQ